MKKVLLPLVFALAFLCGFWINTAFVQEKNESNFKANESDQALKLGAFSVSLSVKNLEVSKEFYEKIGFKVFGGSVKSNYLIMKNGNALIGLFQGMFQGNILTFNPGWDENAKNVKHFIDVREIQKRFKEKGLILSSEADVNSKGPASITLSDPDGNMILLDQHR